MSLYTDDVILPITQTRLPKLLEEISNTGTYAVLPSPGNQPVVEGLLATVMLDFCDVPQYLHLLKGNDEDTVVGFFEGNPQFIEMLESDGLLATLNAVTNFFAIGDVKLESLEPEKTKIPTLGSLTIRIVRLPAALRSKILEELGGVKPKARYVYQALTKLDDAKLTLLAYQIKTQNQTHALNEKADAMQEELNEKPTATEAPAAEPTPEAAAPETPAPIVHEYPVYRNPTLLGFVAGTVAVVGAVALVRRLMK